MTAVVMMMVVMTMVVLMLDDDGDAPEHRHADCSDDRGLASVVMAVAAVATARVRPVPGP